MGCRTPAAGGVVSTTVAAATITLALCSAGCAHGARASGLHVASATELRSADPQATAPVGTGEGVAPRAAQPERARSGLEDTSKKSASLETAAYTDSDRVTVFTPAISGTIENVVDGASLHGSYLVDVVSAASVDIIATASRRWHEVRHAGALSGEYKPHDLGIGFSASVSSEPDYFSYGASGHLSYDFDEKNTSIFFGYGYGHDTIGRSGTSFTTFARSLQRGSLLLGVDQVVGPATLASLSLGVIIENGDQSKPYRYIPMFSPAEAQATPAGASVDYVNAHRLFERPLEQLPLARRRFALSSTLAQRFDSSTLRASERVYIDNWGLKASTTDARWFFDAAERIRLWPHVRFHAQTPVGFWQRAYVSSGQPGFALPELRTGDRELGPLWAATGGGGAKLFLGSAAHPHFFAIAIEADAVYTSYLDDLFISGRTGVLGSLTLEVEEP
ncbi:MAG: hypothetical protein JWP87_2523 [Labilithrix sp.]|nr:hypothetical protein [Labilithrix sp.]